MSVNFWGNVKIGTHVTVEQGATFIKTKVENGGVHNEYVFAKDETTQDVSESGSETKDRMVLLKENLLQFLPRIKSNRHWFSIIKVMMKLKYVTNGDFSGAVAIIENLLQEEAKTFKIDSYDLCRINALSFSKDIEDWDPSNAPVTGAKTFLQYQALAKDFLLLFDGKLSNTF